MEPQSQGTRAAAILRFVLFWGLVALAVYWVLRPGLNDVFETEAYAFPLELRPPELRPLELPGAQPTVRISGRAFAESLGANLSAIGVAVEGEDAVLTLSEPSPTRFGIIRLTGLPVTEASNFIFTLDVAPVSADGGVIQKYHDLRTDFRALVLGRNGDVWMETRYREIGDTDMWHRSSHRRSGPDLGIAGENPGASLAVWNRNGTAGFYVNGALYHSFRHMPLAPVPDDPGAIGIYIEGGAEIRIKSISVFDLGRDETDPSAHISVSDTRAPTDLSLTLEFVEFDTGER